MEPNNGISEEVSDDLLSTQDRQEVIAKLERVSPEFVGTIASFCIGEAFKGSKLPDDMKEVVAMVSLISLGSERLSGHFESALEAGMTKDDIVEVIKLSAIYLGFPRAIDAMLVLEALTSRDSTGCQ